MQAPQTPLSAASGAGARRRAGRAGRPPRKLRARLARIPRWPRRDPSHGTPRPHSPDNCWWPESQHGPETRTEGGEGCVREEHEQTAQRSTAAFLACRPNPARGSWPQSQALEKPRAEGKPWGPLCDALPEGSRQIRTRGAACAAAGGGGGAPRRFLRLTPPLGH